MRTPLACFALLILFPVPASAQDHLFPDTDAFTTRRGEYPLMMRRVFEQAFDEEVILRSLVTSRRKEYVVGVFVKDEKAEAFVLEPSTHISTTARIEELQDQIKYLTEEGIQIPDYTLESLKSAQAQAPADYRKIKVTRAAKPIPRELAEEIKAVWEVMLLDVKHPKELIRGEDGVTHHFSAWVKGHGEISGHVWSPESKAKKTRSLTTLADVLQDYARGKASLDTLKSQVERTQVEVNKEAKDSPASKK